MISVLRKNLKICIEILLMILVSIILLSNNFFMYMIYEDIFIYKILYPLIMTCLSIVFFGSLFCLSCQIGNKLEKRYKK